MTIVYLCLMQALKTDTNLERDGRRLRSSNSQDIIVDAMMEIIKKGVLEPTVQQVADHTLHKSVSVFLQEH